MSLATAAVVTLGAGALAPLAQADAPASAPINPIVGGGQAPEGRWPMAVKIKMTTSGGTFGCGGTLISPDTVLTAQHCLDETPSTMTVQALIGKVDYTQGESRKVVTWKTGAGPRKGDWAVGKLDRPSTITTFAPITPDTSLDRSPWFTAIGWGRLTEGGASKQYLQQVDLPLHTGSGCLPYADAEICASGNGTAGTDTCNGDSGGPLFAKNAYGRDVQVGITS